MLRTIATFLLLLCPVSTAAVAQQADAEAPRVVVIEPVGNEMKYATTEITAKAGTQLTIVMNNTATSTAMHHNVAVLGVVPGDDAAIEEVGMAAVQAGPDAGYIPEHDALLAYTPMAAPGERTEVTFTVPPPGDYAYVCLFPGHFATMRGVLHSTE